MEKVTLKRFDETWQSAALKLIHTAELIGGEDNEGNLGLNFIIDDGQLGDNQPVGRWEIQVRRPYLPF